MAIRTEIAATAPAVIGAIRIGTEVRAGVDSASASSGEGKKGRWRARRLRAFVGSLLTGLAERFVEESGEGFGLFGAFALALVKCQGRLRSTRWVVEQSDMDEETDQHESDQQELVKQWVGCHDNVPFPDGERRLLYRIPSR
jgi:hypothetical protein